MKIGNATVWSIMCDLWLQAAGPWVKGCIMVLVENIDDRTTW